MRPWARVALTLAVPPEEPPSVTVAARAATPSELVPTEVGVALAVGCVSRSPAVVPGPALVAHAIHQTPRVTQSRQHRWVHLERRPEVQPSHPQRVVHVAQIAHVALPALASAAAASAPAALWGSSVAAAGSEAESSAVAAGAESRAHAQLVRLGSGGGDVHAGALDDVVLAAQRLRHFRVGERDEGEGAERLRDEHVDHLQPNKNVSQC